MPNNLIRVKQLDQNELSGFVGQSVASTGLLNNYFVSRVDDQTISGIKTFSVINSPYQISIYPSGQGSINGPLISSNEYLTIAGFNTRQNIKFTDEYASISAGGEGGGVFTSIELNTNGSIYLLGQIVGNTGTFQKLYADNLVYNTGNQIISGNKTFVNSINVSGTGIFNALVANNLQVSGTGIFNSLDLNNIDILSLSGVDITITSGAVTLTNPVSAPNLVYNTGDQTISGVKTFISSGIFSLSGAVPIGLPNNPLSIVGSGNTYLQLNIQNRATGLFASSDLVITANNGNDSSNFINLGINNVGYSDPSFTNGTGLDGYLFIDGGNLDIGTRTAGRAIEFHAGGTTLGSTIARISQSGLNVVSGNLTVGGTGVLLTGQNIFVLQGGTNEGNTTAADTNYIGLAGANIGYSNTSVSRRVPILENCVARKASITLQQAGGGISTSNITGSIVNLTQGLTGIISQSMSSTNNGNFISFSNSNLSVPFSAGDNAAAFIHCPSAIGALRTLVNVYFYN
jgi:hypothetical protein